MRMGLLSTIVAANLGALTSMPALSASGNAPGVERPTAQLIEKGRYLAAAADCVACHTAPHGKPFAGGLALDTPIGKVYSTNITPDTRTGIGSYSFEDFDRALRHGIAKGGYSLYPAMPYPSYAKVQPNDVKALYAYFMNGVGAVEHVNKPVDIPWPLSMRWPLAAWRKMFAPAVTLADAPPSNDPIARGKYLVEGLGHCSACHTPRGIALQEKSLTDDGANFLSGGSIDNYLAKNLRGDVNDGLGRWTEQDIVAFLKGGRNTHSAAFGGMAEVVQNSTQYMSDSDLQAIARYVKTLSPAQPAQSPLVYNTATEIKLRSYGDRNNGALTFVDNCAACHRTTGKGYVGTFPQLAQSPTVNTSNASSLIHIVLTGGEMPWTTTAPTHYAMPGFDSRLTDKDVADVLTFIRQGWGNNAPNVTASEVARVRKAIGASPQPAR